MIKWIYGYAYSDVIFLATAGDSKIAHPKMEIVIFIFGKPDSTTVCSVYIAALCLDVNLKNIIELIRENRFDEYPEGEAEPLACIPTISDLPKK